MKGAVRVAIIHRKRLFREGLACALSQQQDLTVVGSVAEACELLGEMERLRLDVLVLELSLPGREGLGEARRIHQAAPEIKILMIGLSESESDVLACIEAGAAGSLPQEASLADLLHHIRAVAADRYHWMEIDVRDDPRNPRRHIFYVYDQTEVHDLRRQLNVKARFQDLVGASVAMQQIYKLIQQAAQVEATVMIEGETGTGKELVARAIHSLSRRRDGPFIAVNCAALTESVLASQLFGHRRGAFTGAVADHQGLFEAAQGGTLLLDEIGDMPLALQTSLLRVLETQEITRLGESKPRTIDVRILAATHHDLHAAVAQDRFRRDLLYRLRVLRIALPPLRARQGDIPLLVQAFLSQLQAETNRLVQEVSRAAMQRLLAHPWPGNVRELKSCLAYAVMYGNGATIQVEDLPPELLHEPMPDHLAGTVLFSEKDRLVAALQRTGGNRVRAAQLLGIGRTTLYRRLTRLGIPSEP